MSFFATFDEIGEYLENVRGLKYLDNPDVWNKAFRETVKGSKAIEVIDEATGEITHQFWNPKTWSSIGKSVDTGLTGGAKSVPTVETVVTDVATGTATVGEVALATEPVGITIELSLAGYIATGLAGLGLGIGAFELAPHFWTDVSNAIFEPLGAKHVTYEEAEPQLRKKIKGFLAKTTEGKLATYMPSEPLKTLYDFLKPHIIDPDPQYKDFTGITWNAKGQPITGESQIQQQVELGSFSLSYLQYFMDECTMCAHRLGYTNCKSIDVTELYNKAREELDFTRADYVEIQFAVDFEQWNNDFPEHTLVTVLGFQGYNIEDNTVTVVQRQKMYGENTYGYEVTRPEFDTEYILHPVFSTSVSFRDRDSTPYYDIRNNGTSAMYMGTYAKKTVGIRWNCEFHGLNPDPTEEHTRFCTTTLNAVGTKADVDDYLKNAGVVVTGKTPSKKTNFQDQYADWYGKKKTVSQPSGTPTITLDSQREYIPIKTPIGKTDDILRSGYNQDQDKTQDADPTNDNINDYNDSIADGIDDYNDSDDLIDTYPDTPPDNPVYPVRPDPPVDPTPEPPSPPVVIGTASGMISIYNPTKAELGSFAGWLWSPDFLDNFLKIFNNPMDAIIGLHMLYATPITNGRNDIIVGYLNSHVNSKVVSQQYSTIDCGTVNVAEFYGNATDYAPYTKVYCYLPFIGIVPLKADDVMGKKVNITYGIDVLTGTCLASIYTIKDNKRICMYTFTGNCGVQLPISGGNYAGVVRGLIGMAGSVLAGSVIGAVGSALSMKTDVSHSGSIGSNAGVMGIRKPYLIITRYDSFDAVGYNRFYGLPANKTVTLNTCKGFTRVKSVHVDNLPIATDSEKNEIETLLRNGVVIN